MKEIPIKNEQIPIENEDTYYDQIIDQIPIENEEQIPIGKSDTYRKNDQIPIENDVISLIDQIPIENDRYL